MEEERCRVCQGMEGGGVSGQSVADSYNGRVAAAKAQEVVRAVNCGEVRKLGSAGSVESPTI